MATKARALPKRLRQSNGFDWGLFYHRLPVVSDAIDVSVVADVVRTGN